MRMQYYENSIWSERRHDKTVTFLLTFRPRILSIMGKMLISIVFRPLARRILGFPPFLFNYGKKALNYFFNPLKSLNLFVFYNKQLQLNI